jgi:pimeloyl-ACP methyl ester carboxylesterase
MTNNVRSSDGTSIAFDRSGEGSPLVIVGGALSDRSAAASIAPLLAEHFTVFAYDRRGRGDSGDTPPYEVEREVEDLEALIAEAGGSASVFGHSSGAALALRAVIEGLAIDRLALYEPPFIVDDSRPPVPDDYVEHLDELVSAGRRGDAVAYFMTTAVGLPPEMVADMRNGEMWPSLEAVAHTISYDGRILEGTLGGRPIPPERWESVKIPTLVMDGGESPPWQHAAVRELADALPDARHLTLEGQTHGPAEEVLVPVLVAFFSGA